MEWGLWEVSASDARQSLAGESRSDVEWLFDSLLREGWIEAGWNHGEFDLAAGISPGGRGARRVQTLSDIRRMLERLRRGLSSDAEQVSSSKVRAAATAVAEITKAYGARLEPDQFWSTAGVPPREDQRFAKAARGTMETLFPVAATARSTNVVPSASVVLVSDTRGAVIGQLVEYFAALDMVHRALGGAGLRLEFKGRAVPSCVLPARDA